RPRERSHLSHLGFPALRALALRRDAMSAPPSPVAVAISSRSPVEEAAGVLACRTTGDAIDTFLRDRVPSLIVAAAATALPGDIGSVQCTVTRTKLKPHRRLTVSAELHGLGPGPRPVTAIWG